MAVDMFIKIGDIIGESKDQAGHKDEIDVLSWHWGLTQAGTMHVGGGGGAGKANIQDLTITKWFDKASPVLMQYALTGKQFPEAKMTIRKAGGSALEYIKVTLADVICTSVQTGGTGSEDRLVETVVLNFAKFKFEYTAQKQDGSADGGAIPVGWDIAGNVPW